MENKIYDEQIDKLKNLYEHSLEQKQSLQKNVNEFDIMTSGSNHVLPLFKLRKIMDEKKIERNFR